MREVVRFPKIPKIDRLASVGSGAFLGAVSSIAPWHFYGPQAGVEFGAAVGIPTTGVLWSYQSYEQGSNYAALGDKKRAYLKALQSTLEAALSGAAFLAPLGFHLGSIEGAIGAGIAGGAIAGIGSGRFIFGKISTRLQQGVVDNVVEFKPRGT